MGTEPTAALRHYRSGNAPQSPDSHGELPPSRFRKNVCSISPEHPLHTHTTYLARIHRNIFIALSYSLNRFLQTLQQDGLSTSISPAYACMSLYLICLSFVSVEIGISVTPVVRSVFFGRVIDGRNSLRLKRLRLRDQSMRRLRGI